MDAESDQQPDGEPGDVACVVCGERLALASTPNATGTHSPYAWVHRNEDIRPRDHPAVPVEADTTAQSEPVRCDFCSRTPVAGEARFRDFEWSPGQRIGERWPACAACLALLDRNDWNGLLRHAESGVRERTGQGWTDQVRSVMQALYRQLRRNRI